MVEFVLLLDPAEDGDGVFDRRFVHHHGLEAAGEGCVFLHILAVFIQRGGADAVEFTPRKGGFDEVRGIHRAVGFARADEGVHFVDEEDDLAIRAGDFVQHRLQPFLEFTAILRACDQRAHVQRHELLVAQGFRHVAVDDAQSEAFGDCRFADAGFADQDGVVLGAARQDLHGAANLFVAADDGVDLALFRRFGQVAGEFLQRVIAFLGGCRVGGAALADVVDRGIQFLRRDGPGIQRLLRTAGDHGQRHEEAFDGDEAVARLFRQLLRLIQNLHKARIGEGLRITGNFRQFAQRQVDRLKHARRFTTGAADEVGGQPLFVIHDRLEQMFGRKPLVAFPHRDGLRGLQEPARAFRELFKVHRHISFS